MEGFSVGPGAPWPDPRTLRKAVEGQKRPRQDIHTVHEKGMLTPPIQLDKIAFAYGIGKEPVFRDVCLQIAPTARVVLVRCFSHTHKHLLHLSPEEKEMPTVFALI